VTTGSSVVSTTTFFLGALGFDTFFSTGCSTTGVSITSSTTSTVSSTGASSVLTGVIKDCR